MRPLVEFALMGAGATLGMDVWALLLRRTLGVRSLDLSLLGRWVLHVRHGTFLHPNIAAAVAKPHERPVGWVVHYSIGIALALAFALVAPAGWRQHPTLLPALAFGLATVVLPFASLQPAFGLGFASSRTQYPWRARARSVMTHAVFGVGLYVSASVLWCLRAR